MARSHRNLDATRWARVRRKVLARDGYRCQQCGGAGRLEAHHALELAAHPAADPYDEATIITLCRGCHIEAHRPQAPARREWRKHIHERLSA